MNRTDQKSKPVSKKRKYWVLLGLLLFFGMVGLALPFLHHLPFYDKDARKIAYMDKGKTYFEKGKYEEAQIAFRNALQMDAALGEAHYYLGLITLERGSLQDVFRELTLATLYSPNLMAAQIRLGEVYLLAADLERAEQKALLIQAHAPERPEGYLLQGKILMLQENRDSAFAMVNKALQIDSFHLEANMVLASLHLHDGKRDVAEGILKNAVERHPTSVEAYAALAAFYQATGDLEKMEQAYVAAVQAAPENSLSYFLLGQFYITQNRGAAALSQYRQALLVDPKSLMIKKHLSHALLTRGEIARADSLNETLLNTHSGDLDGLYLKGRIALVQGQNSEAIKLLRRVAHRNPHYRFGAYLHDLGYYLGLAYYENGQVLEAREEVRQFLSRYPASTHLKLLLATLSLKLGYDHDVVQSTQSVLLGDPDNLQASLLLGQSSLRTGNRSQMQSSLNRVIEGLEKTLLKDPNNLQASLLLAQTLAQVGNPAEAEQVLAKAVVAHTEDAGAHIGQGHFYRGVRHYKRAEQAYLTAISIAPQNSRAHMDLGQTYAIQGREDLAEKHYLLALTINPEFLMAKKLLAHLFLEQKQVARADSLVGNILAHRSGDIDGLYLKGRIRLAQGVAEEAVAALAQISRQDPTYQFGANPSDLGYYLGLAYYENGRFKDAKEELEHMLERFPQALQVRLLVANLSLRLSEYRKAAEIVEGILQDHPDNLQAALMLGLAYHQNGQVVAAQRAFERSLEQNPNGIQARAWLAELALERGDVGLATAQAREVLKSDPNHVMASLVLGGALLLEKRWDEAGVSFRRALRQDPKNVQAHNGLGLMYSGQNQTKQAVEAFETVLQIKPESIQTLNHIVAIYQAAGQHREAIARCVEHLNRVPNNAALHQMLGAMLLAQGDDRDAEAHLGKAIELDSGLAQSHFFMGLLYEKRGAPQQAIESYEHAMAINPKFAVAANNLAWLLAEMERDLERARSLAEMAQQHMPDDPNVMNTLGWVSYKNRSFHRAVGLLEKCIQKDPANPVFHYQLGMAYYKNGDVKAAQQALEKSLKLNPAYPNAEEARRLLASLDGTGGG